MAGCKQSHESTLETNVYTCCLPSIPFAGCSLPKDVELVGSFQFPQIGLCVQNTLCKFCFPPSVCTSDLLRWQRDCFLLGWFCFCHVVGGSGSGIQWVGDPKSQPFLCSHHPSSSFGGYQLASVSNGSLFK